MGRGLRFLKTVAQQQEQDERRRQEEWRYGISLTMISIISTINQSIIYLNQAKQP